LNQKRIKAWCWLQYVLTSLHVFPAYLTCSCCLSLFAYQRTANFNRCCSSTLYHGTVAPTRERPDIHSTTDPIQQLIQFTRAYYTPILPHFVQYIWCPCTKPHSTSFCVRYVLAVYKHLQFALYIRQQTTYKHEQKRIDTRKGMFSITRFVIMSFT
jgi:hypothetical protein